MSLPYGLKIKDIFSTPKLTGIMDNEYHFGSYLSIDSAEYVKPILRPLSDLTKPIKHKGEEFVPMFELAKLQGFNVGNIKNWNFHFHTENLKVVSGTNGDWMLRYMIDQNSFYVNGLKDWNRKHQKTHNQLSMFQKLIEWHFNLMDEGEEFIDVNTLDINPYE